METIQNTLNSLQKELSIDIKINLVFSKDDYPQNYMQPFNYSVSIVPTTNWYETYVVDVIFEKTNEDIAALKNFLTKVEKIQTALTSFGNVLTKYDAYEVSEYKPSNLFFKFFVITSKKCEIGYYDLTLQKVRNYIESNGYTIDRSGYEWVQFEIKNACEYVGSGEEREKMYKKATDERDMLQNDLTELIKDLPFKTYFKFYNYRTLRISFNPHY